MISEKEMMIVDAVNELKACCAPSRRCKTIYRIGCDELNFGMDVTKDTICIIDEYNQCIREMSEGAFVPDANPEFVYGQDVYVEDPLFSNKELKFGCLTLKGDCAILLTGGGHMVYPLVGISSKPLKTKEEIELEEAKRKQVDDFTLVFSHYFKSIDMAREGISAMQYNGYLSEIILPLESKL